VLQPQVADAGQLGGQSVGDQRRRVGAGVVGDGDGVLVRKVLGKVPMQPVHAGGQIPFLVVDRHGYVEHHSAGRGRCLGRDSVAAKA
jgi:hypothetical protein